MKFSEMEAIDDPEEYFNDPRFIAWMKERGVDLDDENIDLYDLLQTWMEEEDPEL